MKSFTTLQSLYQSITGNVTSTALTLGNQWINDGYRKVLGERQWPFLEKVTTFTTVASQQFYDLPYNTDLLMDIYVTVGTTRWTPIEAPNEAFWNNLNMTTYTSDIPTYYYILAGQVGLYPMPSSTGNTVTLNIKQRVKDLSIADYTTGNILTATLGSASIVGTGTTWTQAMVGRWLRITDSDTANKGDGFWYEIMTFGSATTLTLDKLYGGTSIAAGAAAYTIGQMPVLPETYQMLPIYYAVSQYYQSGNQPEKAVQYDRMYEEMLKTMAGDYGNKTANVRIVRHMETFPNPNNFLQYT